MRQYEILKLASIGLLTKIKNEEKYRDMAEARGKTTSIAHRKIEKYERQYEELSKMIIEEEEAMR